MSSHVPPETPADRARRECESQGVPFQVSDADALAFVADLVSTDADR
jgi:hypothetical protein